MKKLLLCPLLLLGLQSGAASANPICVAQKIVSDITMKYFVSCSDGSELFTDNILTFILPYQWTTKANRLLRSEMLDRNYFLDAKIPANNQRWFWHDVLVFSKKKQNKTYCIVKKSDPISIGYNNKTTVYNYNLACSNQYAESFSGIPDSEFDSIMKNKRLKFVFKSQDNTYKDVQSLLVYRQ